MRASWVLARELTDEAAFAQYQDTGRQTEQFRKFAGDQQDPRALLCKRIKQAMNLRFGSDIDATRWFVDDQDAFGLAGDEGDPAESPHGAERDDEWVYS